MMKRREYNPGERKKIIFISNVGINKQNLHIRRVELVYNEEHAPFVRPRNTVKQKEVEERE